MAGDTTSRLDKTARHAGRSDAAEDSFDTDFAKLKLKVIKPAFNALAEWLKARGNEVEIAEDSAGNMSMHIVPAGIDRSSRPHDRFPTFSVLGSSFNMTVGLQVRNTRPDSAAASGTRSVYTLAQINNVILEAELMKFVDEVGKW